MTRHFFNCIFLPAILLAAQSPAQAGLIKSSVLENNVAYLRLGEVGKNLADEIQSAQTTLAATNKIAGTVLDLRFAGGDDYEAERAAENLLTSARLPLAILINAGTRGAAARLAADLREARAGLVLGNPSGDLQPDISVPVNSGAEKGLLENPFATLAQGPTNADTGTNDFLPFIDHISEADLVREKIKDGDEDENAAPSKTAPPPKPFIRDPVLARAVDLVKGLDIFLQSQPKKSQRPA
jgi:hypothetical protein